MHGAATTHGTSGSAAGLPRLEQIQRSFGHHDVSHPKVHVGGHAAGAASAMGVDAFATGQHVALRRTT